MPTHPAEVDFRRRWYEAHRARYELDDEFAANQAAGWAGFAPSAAEAFALRDALATSGDVEAFHHGLQSWAAKPTTVAFNGFSGLMLLNQLVKRSDDSNALARVLADALATPRDDASAGAKIQALVDYIETVRVGSHPAPGRASFFASYFWALDDHGRWPIIWASATDFLEFITGSPLPPAPADQYLRFLELARELDDDLVRVEQVAAWWKHRKPVFLDPVLADRCAFGLDRNAQPFEALADNAAALVSMAGHIGTELADDVSRAAGRTLWPRKPNRLWAEERPRSDLWATWTATGSGPGIRVWVNHNGASIGLAPGWVRKGWFDEAQAVVETATVPGFRLLCSKGGKRGDDVGFIGGMFGEFAYARWYDRESLATLDVRAETVRVAALMQPLLDRLIALATGENASPPKPDDPLVPLVKEFIERGYPSPADEEHRADRAAFAALLAADNVALADPIELRRIWNTSRYGSPGPQSVLNTSLRDADAAEYDRIMDSLRYLCWGDGEDAARIDKLLEEDAFRVKGLGESVMLKLLAICHPERYLPVFPYSGPKGKRQLLQLLGQPEPAAATRGKLQVLANDALRDRVDSFFPGDPWGMTRFLYWYSERESEPVAPPEVDPLADLAEQLLIDRVFIDDIVALLADKGQVILYGPPGTGKTYLARKLAEALVPDPTRRMLVQFHPSTSYEDFFEGYRPETNVGGEMSYRLTPGPLALLAHRAADAPGKRHIMIIDEINRANLPKVLGELLFLFEYRDEQVRTLYRPDDAFELPKDLWFIGTMNTADRSIALVDAALRRRFNFIPFFPDRGPMRGLLDRWLAAHNEPTWVGELVAMVNDELCRELGGSHLLLGPSHFMKSGLDEQLLRRIWEYNIEPFIEDQFFGDPGQIESFRFPAVLRRYLEAMSVSDVAQLGSADSAAGPSPEAELPAQVPVNGT